MRNEYEKRLRETKKILGICRDCSSKTNGKVRCSICSKKHNEKQRIYREENREKYNRYHKEYQSKRKEKDKHYYKIKALKTGREVCL